MRHLVIYSHPYPKSFNHAIKDVYVQALTAAGHEVRVRDLYAIDFDPVLKAEELAGFQQGAMPADIKAEQEHVLWADILTLICPVWWGGPTANLRGYLDRVFCRGFAYDAAGKGLLSSKKVLTIHTLGAPLKVYEDAGLIAAMDKIYDEITFKFAGLQIAGHKYFGLVTACSEVERLKMLAEVKEIARTIR